MPFVFPIIESLFLPPGLFVLLMAVALVLLSVKRRKAGFVLGAVSCLFLLICSLTPFADLLIVPLENRYPAYRFSTGREADYVVVLGGGIVPDSPAEGGKGSLGPDSLKRLIYAARIARNTKLPLIVSGGVVPSFPSRESEAAIARRALGNMGFGGLTVLVEEKSRNTWENASLTETRYHPHEAILVTSAYHMPRSVLAFERNGVEVIPAPTDYLSDRGGYTFYSFLPTASSLRVSAIALKEYLGYLYYSLFLFTTRHSS